MTLRFARFGLLAGLTAFTLIHCGSDDSSDATGGADGGGAASGGDAGSGAAAAGGSATGGASGNGAATGGAGGNGAATGGTGGALVDARSPEATGDRCESPLDCYPYVDHDALAGEVQCLDRVEDGYCTHLCETDDDCCAVEGECRTDLKQVCAPFEATGQKFCFLSCEAEDRRAPPDAGLPDGAIVDATEYCAREAHPSFICRSTGGGVENRRVCVPGGVEEDAGPLPDVVAPAPDAGPPEDASVPEDAALPDAAPDAAPDADADDAAPDAPDAG